MPMNKKTRFPGCVSLLITLTSFWLIGCATSSLPSTVLPAQTVYQPRVLTLPAGKPVQTEAGVYTPQFREIWHSQEAFHALETQILDLSQALAQERARDK